MIKGFKTSGVIQPDKHSTITAKVINTAKVELHHDNFFPVESSSLYHSSSLASLANLIPIAATATGHAKGFVRVSKSLKKGDFSKQVIVSSDNPIDIVFHEAKKDYFTFGQYSNNHQHGGSLLGHKTMPNCLIQHKLLGKTLQLHASGYIKCPKTASDPQISFYLEQNYFNHHAGTVKITSDKLINLEPVALRHGLIPWSIKARLSGSVGCNYQIIIDGVTHSGSGLSSRSKDGFIQISLSTEYQGGIKGRDGLEVVMTQLEIQ